MSSLSQVKCLLFLYRLDLTKEHWTSLPSARGMPWTQSEPQRSRLKERFSSLAPLSKSKGRLKRLNFSPQGDL